MFVYFSHQVSHLMGHTRHKSVWNLLGFQSVDMFKGVFLLDQLMKKETKQNTHTDTDYLGSVNMKGNKKFIHSLIVYSAHNFSL